MLKLFMVFLLVSIGATSCMTISQSSSTTTAINSLPQGVNLPPPLDEEKGSPPYLGYFWIEGYWVWNGSTFSWHAGHWESPRLGLRWVPDRWYIDGTQWHFEHGYWLKY